MPKHTWKPCGPGGPAGPVVPRAPAGPTCACMYWYWSGPKVGPFSLLANGSAN